MLFLAMPFVMLLLAMLLLAMFLLANFLAAAAAVHACIRHHVFEVALPNNLILIRYLNIL